MQIDFQYGHEVLNLNLPDDSIVYESKYKDTGKSANELLQESMKNPVSSKKLTELIKIRRPGKVVIVVSDITRPIPYHEFLPQLLAILEENGVLREEIELLVATGMHRASTREEHLRMFGENVVNNYAISDHDCQDAKNLELLRKRSWSGSRVRLNKKYVRAGFRIVTGLVEPHFMAGFSGGRKAICPGLVDLQTIQKFHGYTFLSHPNATSSVMVDNPCNLENTSVAQLCPPDFSVNIILDNHKKINAIVSGELFASHQISINYVKAACCPPVTETADVALTSSGGYPLDATFYQCVKGLVNCLPSVREEGEIIAFGSCMEGIGSPEYTAIMEKYSGDYHWFIEDIKENRFFIKDQWQLQMQIRVLKKTGQKNLHFYTSNIPLPVLSLLSVTPHAVAASEMERAVQNLINQSVAANKRFAVFPEGPYCSPVSRQ
jgi:nickel-dependent lactate racemase